MSAENSNISNFATVGEVFEDGVSLIFDGQETATEKHYKVNTSIVFSAGDRVKILADSGTYVVEYVVGAPKKTEDTEGNNSNIIPTGGSEGQALVKASSNDYDTKWGSPDGILPPGGSDGQVLAKSGSVEYSAEWVDFEGTIPTGGSTGQVLMKASSLDHSVKWGDVDVDGTLPTGGSTDQVLIKSSSANYSAKWADNVANSVKNQINSGASYVIQFRTTSISSSSAQFQIRFGPYGTWKTISVS